MLRVFLLLLLTLEACAPRPDLEADRAELLRMHALAQTAHLDKRPDLMVASFADSFLNISRGAVTVRTPAESRARFQAYFDRSTFLEWADLAPPVIRISPDGQMAYVIVQKRVRAECVGQRGGGAARAHDIRVGGALRKARREVDADGGGVDGPARRKLIR